MPQVQVFAIWCPRGDDCRRGGKMLAKGSSDEDVRERLKLHLRAAPGHADLDEHEIELVAGLAEVSDGMEDAVVPKQPATPPPTQAMKRARGNAELANVVSQAVASGIQAPMSGA